MKAALRTMFARAKASSALLMAVFSRENLKTMPEKALVFSNGHPETSSMELGRKARFSPAS